MTTLQAPEQYAEWLRASWAACAFQQSRNLRTEQRPYWREYIMDEIYLSACWIENSLRAEATP